MTDLNFYSAMNSRDRFIFSIEVHVGWNELFIYDNKLSIIALGNKIPSDNLPFDLPSPKEIENWFIFRNIWWQELIDYKSSQSNTKESTISETDYYYFLERFLNRKDFNCEIRKKALIYKRSYRDNREVSNPVYYIFTDDPKVQVYIKTAGVSAILAEFGEDLKKKVEEFQRADC